MSATVRLESLPYRGDSCGLFERVRELPCALFLDSGHPHSGRGRFDIVAAAPLASFPLAAGQAADYGGMRDYFGGVAAYHAEACAGVAAPAAGIPFCGGVAGCLDFGAGKPLQYMAAEDGPGGSLHFYHWAVIQDHLHRRCTLASLPSLRKSERADLLKRLRSRGPGAKAAVDMQTAPAASANQTVSCAALASAVQTKQTRQPGQSAPIAQAAHATAAEFRLLAPFAADMDRAAYRDAFRAIQRYILAGDCYQVNLARRFSSWYEGDPWGAYLQLRPIAGAPFSAYMQRGDGQVLLCLSPERFLHLAGRQAETRPIKGTRPRREDPAADARAAEELRRSSKDRAENLMITDLLRNDLARNCLPGSIRADRLFELESFPTVHHLVSTISGELRPGRTAFDLLRDSFPGGSITGAPKRRAMQIIDELEPAPRSAYCGSVFYISADGRMDSNIAIRTLMCDRDAIHCWAGGGIVADSDCESEFQETWDKVGPFLQSLEAISGLQ